MQRDCGSGATQSIDDGAILELLEHIARLPLPGKAGEPCAASTNTPRRNSDREAGDGRRNFLDIDPTSVQGPCKRIVVRRKIGAVRRIRGGNDVRVPWICGVVLPHAHSPSTSYLD